MTPELRLDEACSLIVDCPHKTAPESAEAFAYAVGTKAIRDGRIDLGQARPVSRETYNTWISRATPQPGDVILCREAPVGPVARVPDEPLVCLGQRTVLLRADPSQIGPDYLFYALITPQAQSALRTLSEGSTVAHLNVADVRRFRLPLPSLEEQRSVTAILRAVDDKIDSNRRLTDLLEETAATLFKARFVDFVGVERLQESAVGPIPDGWRTVPFSDAVEINPKVKIPRGLDAPFIEMSSVDPWATRPSRTAARPVSSGSRFGPGDTLMARITGCIENGKGAFLDYLEEPGTGSTEFIVVRAKAPLTPEIAFLYSRWQPLRDHAIASMTGSSGRQRVVTSCFDDFLVAIPDHPGEIADTAKVIEALMAQSLALWRETLTLSELRDALLPTLISGAVRVPDTADSLEATEAAAEAA